MDKQAIATLLRQAAQMLETGCLHNEIVPVLCQAIQQLEALVEDQKENDDGSM